EKWLKISSAERRTFLLHLTYSMADGLIMGLFALNEFILIKGLKGTNYQIGFLFQFTVLVLLLSIVINEFFKRIRRKKKLIRLVAVFTRLPLVLFALFPATYANPGNFIYYQMAFLFIFLFYFMANPLLFPAINHLLKNSYSHQNFGRLYGYVSSINKIMMLFATFFFGLILDINQFAFTFIYPMVAVLGISSIFILTKIDYDAPEFNEPKKKFLVSVMGSLKNSILILKENKPYRDFEIAFMFYGFAWMATAAVITIFFEKVLGLNYSSIAFYKNSYNTLAILVLPYFGKLLGKIDPRKFAILTFSSLLLHLFFMGLTEFTPLYFNFWELKIYYSLIASYIFYGLFAAMMALLWYIGSAYFCKNEEASSYQSIHLSLTGARGLFAPLIGVYFYELIGFSGVFGISVISLAIAVLVMLHSMKKHRLELLQTDIV
ncbi:MAG: MFS transporter, partial [Bacteroidales bacterium]|nr:MFS transporter [Bacteroidales bacterium]